MENITIIHKLDQIRVNMKVTKKDIAGYADITPEYYIKLLSNKHNVSVNVLEKLAERLGFELKLCVK